MSFNQLLNQTCIIERKTTTPNQYGHTSNSWNSINDAELCNIQYNTKTPQANQTKSGQMNSNEYIGFFDKNADIESGDRVTWQGLILFVKIPNPVFGFSAVHHKEVLLSLQET